MTLLGATQGIVGLYEQALGALSAAGDRAARLRTPFNLANIAASLGQVCLSMGRVADALGHFSAAMQHAEQIGEQRIMAVGLAGKARALCCEGDDHDPDRALHCAQQALALTEERAPPAEAEARLALAQASLALGHQEDAMAHALETVAIMERLGTQESYEIEILLTAYDALSLGGQTEQAEQMLERAWRMLNRRARRIGDAEVRESYQNNVPHNRRVFELWQQARPAS